MLFIFLDHKVFWDLALQWQFQLNDPPIINRINGAMEGDLVIMFGLNNYSGPMPKNYIAVQLEQSTSVTDGSKGWFTRKYMDALRGAVAVWDYSIVNCRNLKSCNPNYKFLNLGFGCRWAGGRPTPSSMGGKEFDVVFVGQLNDRRRKVLDKLGELGITYLVLENTWGRERLKSLQKGRVVLNVHFFPEGILETVRLSYLLSNAMLVVSEKSADAVLDHVHQKYLFLAEYDKLVDCVIGVLNSEGLQREKLSMIERDYPKTETALPLDRQQEGISVLLSVACRDRSSVEGLKEDPETGNPPLELEDLISNSQDIKSVDLSTDGGALVMRLRKFDEEELPCVSVVTLTYNRRHMFRLPIRNFFHFQYPAEKLEWVIVDDSTLDNQDLDEVLPRDPRINYIKIREGERPLDIGRKRNLGVERAKYEYVCMMDDDDYYYPLSIHSRIATLLSYPEYSCVGTCELDVYDIVNHSCMRFQSANMSEASMGFSKQFWREGRFPEIEHALGEGHGFTRQRRHQLIRIPSCFNLIAITHGNNFTGRRRLLAPQNRVDLLKQLDLETKLFLGGMGAFGASLQR